METAGSSEVQILVSHRLSVLKASYLAALGFNFLLCKVGT